MFVLRTFIETAVEKRENKLESKRMPPVRWI